MEIIMIRKYYVFIILFILYPIYLGCNTNNSTITNGHANNSQAKQVSNISSHSDIETFTKEVASTTIEFCKQSLLRSGKEYDLLSKADKDAVTPNEYLASYSIVSPKEDELFLKALSIASFSIASLTIMDKQASSNVEIYFPDIDNLEEADKKLILTKYISNQQVPMKAMNIYFDLTQQDNGWKIRFLAILRG